jgi:hypothetical protein
MTPTQAIKQSGSRQQLALILGVSKRATYKWKGELPEKQLLKLRVLKPEWFNQEKK